TLTSFRRLVGLMSELVAAIRRVHANLWSGKTTGLGMFRDPATGRVFLAAMANEGNGFPRPQVRDVLPREVETHRFDQDMCPHKYRWDNGTPHAEIRLYCWGRQ